MTTNARTLLFVHPSDELYGADRVLLEIVRGLRPDDRALVVLPTDIAYAGELTHALRELGAEVRHIDMAILRRANLQPRRLPRLCWRFVRGSLAIACLARSRDVALIHSNTLAAPCGAVAAALARRPHLWDVHENLADEPRAYASLLRALLSLAPGKVLANSISSARSLVGASARRKRKTRVLYYGVPDPFPLAKFPPPRAEPGELRVCFLGRLTPRKGIGEALEAVALLHASGVAVRFDVYGSAPPGQEWRDAAWREQAERLGIAGITTFHGFVPDARERLLECDVLLVPSQRPEPFGLVLVEGMLAQRAVVATRNGGGSDEILEDGRTGLYCERDPPAIAATLERLARDPELLRALGPAARDAALERFSVARFHAEMLSIYDLLTSASSKM
ncbi:MAG: glycosyl transferase family 1 [Chloroflexi bacterium]|nr:MAG: glycosyl transferase family 1 [Chloroflexota bacterium]